MDFEILGCVVVIQRKVVVQQNGFTMSYRFKNRLKGYNKKSHRFRLKCVPSIWIIDIDFEWPSRMGIRFVPWSLEFTRNSQAFVVHWSFEASWVKALGHVVTRCCYKWDPLSLPGTRYSFSLMTRATAVHCMPLKPTMGWFLSEQRCCRPGEFHVPHGGFGFVW